MIYAEAACLTALLAVGLVSAYTDFRGGIIPNRLILAGLAAGVLCHAALLLLGAAPYYPYWLLCMAIADALAFGMFWGKLWAAGDAKLFMTLFFLTPPRLFDSGQLSNSVIPYIFIFIPALLWMLGDSVLRFARKEPRKRQPFDLKGWAVSCLKTIVEVTMVHSVIFALFPDFVQNNELLFFSLIMVYAYICGNTDIMRRWAVVAIHAAVTAGLWICMGWGLAVPDFRGYLILVLVMVIQRVAGLYNYQLLPTAKAARGMIPAAETVILFQPSRVQHLPEDASEQLTAKMTEEQADAVRRWEKSAYGRPEIWIVRKVPFAFMIALGFIAWMIFRLVR